MPNEEQDMIAHLLKVEEEAAELINQAHVDSDKEIASARAQADAEFNRQYESMASQMESEFNARIAGIDQNHKNQIEEYKSEIERTPKDLDSFNKLLDKIL